MEVPATSAGVLAEIRTPAGAVAPVGAVVAVVSDGSARRKPAAAAQVASTGAPPKTPAHRCRPGAEPARAARRRRGAGASGRADRDRSVPRGAHARAQLRPGPACRAAHGDAAGAAARRRGRHRSRPHRLSGPHGRIVARDVETAIARGGAAPAPRGRTLGRPRQGALRARPYEEVAARRHAARPSRPG